MQKKYGNFIHEWPSIEHYKVPNFEDPKRRIKKIFAEGTFYVEEKIDGSQLSFRMHEQDQIVLFKTKANYLSSADPFSNKMFAPTILSIASLQHLLNPEYIYRGEAVCKPRHNRLQYQRTPKHYFVLFDVEHVTSKTLLSPTEKQQEAQRLGLEVVPLLFVGNGVQDEPQVLEIVKNMDLGLVTSLLGANCKPEGVVVKNYTSLHKYNEPCLLKLVRQEFRESVQCKIEKQDYVPLESMIGAQYATEARYFKAIQHLRDANVLNDNIHCDLPLLIRELDHDLLKEYKKDISVALLAHLFPSIAQEARQGFVEYYKNYLTQQ